MSPKATKIFPRNETEVLSEREFDPLPSSLSLSLILLLFLTVREEEGEDGRKNERRKKEENSKPNLTFCPPGGARHESGEFLSFDSRFQNVNNLSFLAPQRL